MRLVVFNDATDASLRLLDLLRLQPGVEIAGVTSDEYEAIRLIRASAPDTILFDIASPLHWGLAILDAMRRSDHRARVVVLTQQTEAAYRELWQRLGVSEIRDRRQELYAWLNDMSPPTDHARYGANVIPLVPPSSRLSGKTSPTAAVYPSHGHGLPRKKPD